MMNVNATPNGTRMMWNPSVKAICCRAGSRWEGSPAASAAWAAAHDARLAEVISSLRASSSAGGKPSISWVNHAVVIAHPAVDHERGGGSILDIGHWGQVPPSGTKSPAGAPQKLEAHGAGRYVRVEQG